MEICHESREVGMKENKTGQVRDQNLCSGHVSFILPLKNGKSGVTKSSMRNGPTSMRLAR
jgi:hypothetical protein